MDERRDLQVSVVRGGRSCRVLLVSAWAYVAAWRRGGADDGSVAPRVAVSCGSRDVISDSSRERTIGDGACGGGDGERASA